MSRFICHFVFLLALGFLVSCSEGPSFTEEDEERYDRAIASSGPGWSYWFPRPVWYDISDKSFGTRLVSNNVRNGIAYCSGGIQLTSEQKREIVTGFQGFLSAGSRSIESARWAIEGIAFKGDQFSSSDTVQAYRVFTDCVLNYLENERQVCRFDCQSFRDTSLESIFFRHKQCMDTSVNKCITECIKAYYYDTDDCYRNFCRKEDDRNITNWSGRCERKYDILDEVEDLNSDLYYCESRC